MADIEANVETQEQENQLTPANVTKYQTAADIAQRSLSKVIEAVKPGVSIIELCQLGDETIVAISKTVFNKGSVPKGVAFPTSVSVGTALCHVSPLPSDPEASIVLKEGELVRIELGAHVDGYIAQVAHTVVVGASKSAPIKGRQADVLQAAYSACEAAIRLIKPGNNNFQVTDAIQKVAQDFECIPVQGMMSHQILRNEFDGEKQIVLNPSEQARKEVKEVVFEEGEVYGVDIVITTGSGKPKSGNTRTTIFKRDPAVTYSLKMKASRAVFTQINKECGTMGFTLRSLEDEKKARLGITECQTHGLVVPYEVLHEKEDALTAHMMFTVLLMPNGPLKISGAPWDQELVQSEKTLKDQELVDLLAQPIRSSKKNKKKAKAAAAAQE